MLRLVLALLVVASHLSNFEIGRPAVFVFFMLSGFWVMRMYANTRPQPSHIATFYLSRAMRIVLPFAAAFLLSTIAFEIFGARDTVGILPGIFLLGIASHHIDVLGVSWSLDIELQFYLAVPVLYLLLVSRQVTQAMKLVIVITATLLGWALQQVWGVWTFLMFLPTFVAGALVWEHWWIPSRPLLLGSLLLFLAVGAELIGIPILRSFLLKNVEPPINSDIFGMAWTGLLVPFVAWNLAQKSDALDRHLGNFSFPLYLVHYPVIALVKLGGPMSTLDKGFAAVASILVAFVFYVTIDRPLERMRVLFVKRWSNSSFVQNSKMATPP